MRGNSMDASGGGRGDSLVQYPNSIPTTGSNISNIFLNGSDGVFIEGFMGVSNDSQGYVEIFLNFMR